MSNVAIMLDVTMSKVLCLPEEAEEDGEGEGEYEQQEPAVPDQVGSEGSYSNTSSVQHSEQGTHQGAPPHAHQLQGCNGAGTYLHTLTLDV